VTTAYEASVTVEAAPDRVWAVLADVRAWPKWDSGITRVRGRLAPGAKLRLTAGKLGKGYPFKVTELVPQERVVLTGSTPLGVFTGVRTYTLAATGDSTTLTVREEYSGRLAKAVLTTMPDLTASFEQFAMGLKQQVEASAAGAG
jgi:hypothetical protein